MKAMVLQRVKYGVEIGLNTISILPWTAVFQKEQRYKSGHRNQKYERRHRHRHFGPATVDVSKKAHEGPLAVSFAYRLAGVELDYAADVGGKTSACIRFARLSGSKHFKVGGFATSSRVKVAVQDLTVQSSASTAPATPQLQFFASDEDGVVEFDAVLGPAIVILIEDHGIDKKVVGTHVG